MKNKSAGKGDKARNCFSKEFKDNYDSINWTINSKPVEENKLKANKKA
jgi:hypothetical protein